MNLEVLSQVAELTGSLELLPGSDPDSLVKIRRLIASTLLAGKNVTGSLLRIPGPLIEDLPADIAEQLRQIVASAQPIHGVSVTRQIEPRATSIERLGPFKDEDGRLIWFDIHRNRSSIGVSYADPTLPPREVLRLPNFPIVVESLEQNLPAGSVWLAAKIFDMASPKDAFVGLRIIRGVLRLSRLPQSIENNVIRLAERTKVTLQLVLEHPVSPAVEGSGDAVSSVSIPPRHVTFQFDRLANGKLIEADPAIVEFLGNRVSLSTPTRAVGKYMAALGQVWFPLFAERTILEIAGSNSEIFKISGRIELSEAGWSLPVLAAEKGQAATLGEATGATSLGLLLPSGLKSDFVVTTDKHSVSLGPTTVLIETGKVLIQPRSFPSGLRQGIRLWGQHSRLSLRGVAGSTIRYEAFATEGGLQTLHFGEFQCSATLDRPVTAAGQRVPFFSRRASFRVTTQGGKTRIELDAPADDPLDPITGRPVSPTGLSFALFNGLAVTSPANRLIASTTLDADGNSLAGRVVLHHGLRLLIPTLPDPYAANITRKPPEPRAENANMPQIAIKIVWDSPDRPLVAFHFHRNRPHPDGFAELVPHRSSDGSKEIHLIQREFRKVSGVGLDNLRLLDVSSNADLFGVGYSPEPDISPGLSVRGLNLRAPTQNVTAFTLPAFQWEPVYNYAVPSVPQELGRFDSPTDGGATRLALPSATLVAVDPLSVVSHMLAAYGGENLSLAARFTLPFGIVAVAKLSSGTWPFDPFLVPRFNDIRPEFGIAGLSGGLQLSLLAPLQSKIGEARLPGKTAQTDNCFNDTNVLDSADVDSMFNETFAGDAGSVPISRIDLSGYGASIFSDWRNPGVDPPGITQVKFDGIVGRTVREVVQVRSRLYPWGADVVRTITIERTSSGKPIRRDSGWQAASDGVFELPLVVVHKGIVNRLTNIRRIRETSGVHEVISQSEEVRLVQVVFDADVEVEGATAGADSANLVHCRDLVGFVQVMPTKQPLTPKQLATLIQAKGPIGGPIDCEVNVGQSGLYFRLSRIEVDKTALPSGAPEFVVTSRGSPELPRAGQWTMAFRNIGEEEPRVLKSSTAFPLIRANQTGPTAEPYRFADPIELYRPSNPETEYAIVVSMDAQRMLLPQPQVREGDRTLYASGPLLFADTYALAGTVTLFPSAARCHPLPDGTVFELTGRRKAKLVVPPQPELASGEFPAVVGDRTLSDSAGLKVRASFAPGASICLSVDSDGSPDWNCSFGPVATIADVDTYKDLMRVKGRITSSSRSAPVFRGPNPLLVGPQVEFGGPMASVQEVIEFLTAFGIPFPSDVSITNSTYLFAIGLRFFYPLPEPTAQLTDKGIKAGIGIKSKLDLVVGFGQKRKDGKYGGWHAFFACEAKLAAKTISIIEIAKLYLGGKLKLKIAGKDEGKTEVTLSVGLYGAIEADLFVLVISGGRTYSFVSRVTTGSSEKIGLGLSMGFDVEGVLLLGLVSVALSFDVMALLEKNSDFKFSCETMLAIDFTLGWVFNKSFEIEFELNEVLEAAGFAAGTVLPLH